MELGFEDVYADDSYIDVEDDGKRYLLHLLYVPPCKRGNGEGKALFASMIRELPNHVESVRLKSAQLGSGCTMAFWKSLGFTEAYSECDAEDEGKILHLAVNGFNLPKVESLAGGEKRHYIFD